MKEQELILLKQQSEINELRSKMEGEENERQRFSMELHDGIGAQLSSALMHLSSLKDNVPEVLGSASFGDVENILTSTADDLRQVSRNLIPDTLQRLGLSEALSEYVASVKKPAKLHLHFQKYGPLETVSEELQLFVYRIVQELIHNIIKHAQANYALVQVINNSKFISITSEDDGVGFEHEKLSSGHGLRNIQTRVHQLNGSFYITSAPHKGTSIDIQLGVKIFENEKQNKGRNN